MVDEGRASRILRSITDRVRRLEIASSHRDDSPESLWLDGVKYLFITAIEGCVDVAHHIASSESWEAPDTNADAVRLLGRHGVVANDLASSVARSVGFRNVLVHQYVAVDDAIVIDALGRLDDLRGFVAQVSTWILDQSSDSGQKIE